MNFTRIGPKGQDLAETAKKFDLVRDEATSLYWTTARSLKELTFAEAEAWAKSLRIGGFDDWRLPTIQKRLAIVDYERHSPAIDVAAFGKKATYGWEWTSTVYAPDSGDRWCVSLGNGLTDVRPHSCTAFARAVRAGQ